MKFEIVKPDGKAKGEPPVALKLETNAQGVPVVWASKANGIWFEIVRFREDGVIETDKFDYAHALDLKQGD